MSPNTMASLVSSIELCNACHSSTATTFCNHVCTCLRLSGMPHQVSNDITPPIWLSPSRAGPNGLHELQLFGHDEAAVTLQPDETPTMEPAIKYQKTPQNTCPLTLVISSSSTTSSSDSPFKSSPAEVFVMGHEGTSLTAVTFLGSKWSDTSIGEVKEVRNTMPFGQADTATEREARVLRYKEKKKKRMIENRIRYTSRTTQSGLRPRIRGCSINKSPGSSQPTTL